MTFVRHSKHVHMVHEFCQEVKYNFKCHVHKHNNVQRKDKRQNRD